MSSSVKATLWVAFFCLCMLPVACREGATAPQSHEPIAISLSFSPGDTFWYDAVLIDEYGYYMRSSLGSATQQVLTTEDTLAGMRHVVDVRDSTVLLRDSTAIEREFSLAQSSDGDLYQFGFLTEAARMLNLAAPPEAWDRMAAFSEGFASSWLVGFLDLDRRKPVYGSFDGVRELFSAKVNGVQTVFSCYKVNMYGEGLSYSFWISDRPTAFLHTILESTESTKGAEFVLTDMRVRVQ
jgi:hypothetical protein